MKKCKIWIFQPENAFLTFGLIIGILLVFLTPLGAGFDEDTHIARIWEMSQFEFIPNRLLGQGPYFPQVFYKISYRQETIIHPTGIDFYKDNINLKIDWDNMINHKTRSLYSPLAYLPQAFIMGLFGRLLDAPVMLIYFLLRLSYLFSYILMVYVAIRIIPFGKNILALLAFAPMAIIQASIVSPDAISNGVSFLFIAWVFYLCGQKEGSISKRHIYITWLMVVFLASVKINSMPLILLLVFIPKRFFHDRKEFTYFWVVNIIITIIFCGGWNFITLMNPGNAGNDQDIFSFERLFEFGTNGSIILHSFWEDMKIHFLQYYREWIGVFGYGYWELPYSIYILYPALLLVALLHDSTNGAFRKWQRIFMILLCTVGVWFVIFIFQILVTANGDFSLSGLQGRYFIPLMPLLIFALMSSKPVLKAQDRYKAINLVGSLAVLGVGLIIPAILVYHVTCGSSYYQNGLCYLPKYKNWAPESNLSDPLMDEQVYEETFLFECSPVKEIRVWIDPNGHDIDGELCARLTGVDFNENILLEELELSEPGKAGWLTLSLSDFYPDLNTPYRFSVQRTGTLEDIRLGLSFRDDNKDGVLIIDEEPTDYDLLFEYGCSVEK